MKIKAQKGDIYRKVGILYQWLIQGIVYSLTIITLTIALTASYMIIFGEVKHSMLLLSYVCFVGGIYCIKLILEENYERDQDRI